MKFFLDSDWCAIILSRPCSSCYGNLAVVMVSLFRQLSVMTHSARSAPNIAYRCYLLNFEKPLGKLRSWAWFQAFLCRLGAHQVVWLKSPPHYLHWTQGWYCMSCLHCITAHCSIFESRPPVVFTLQKWKLEHLLAHQTYCVLNPQPLEWKMIDWVYLFGI